MLENKIENGFERKITEFQTFSEKIKFFAATWKFNKIPNSLLPCKFTSIFNYFVKTFNSYPIINITESEWQLIQEFIKLKYPSNLVKFETKKTCLEFWISVLKKSKNNPNEMLLESVLLLLPHENFKDVYKDSLETYMKLMKSCVKYISSLILSNILKDQDNVNIILKQLHFYCKSKSFKELFLSELLIPLIEMLNSLNSIKYLEDFLDLVNQTYFSQLGIEDAEDQAELFDIFKNDLEEAQIFCLLESFVRGNRKNAAEVVKIIKTVYLEKISDKEGIEFLSDIEKIFGILKKYDLDISSVKRLDAETFQEIESKVEECIENLEEQENLTKFFEIVTSLIDLDPFLFQHNIYEIIVDTMFREKSLLESDRFEKFLQISMKFFGKDIIYFVENLMANIEEKLENHKIEKSGKRKLSDGNESNQRKRKSILLQEFHVEDPETPKFWPESLNKQFSDSVIALNVKQSLKLWNTLNEFIRKYLLELKSALNENLMFKLDFVVTLTNHFLLSSRLHEHLSHKHEEIVKEIENFNKIQNDFHSLILNIEYNSRLMVCFLTLSQNYENFLLIYFYHFSPDTKSKLSGIFINNNFGKSSEWSIIKQRVKNFGEPQEKNITNLLGLQQILISQMFNKSEKTILEDVEQILADPKQIEFLLEHSELKFLFLQQLKTKELKSLCEFLIKSDNLEFRRKILTTIGNDPKQLACLLDTLLAIDVDSPRKLEILKLLPLNFLIMEKKKQIFEFLMKIQDLGKSDLSPIVADLFAQEGYKSFFKDFKLLDLLKTFKDTEKYSSIYKIIFQLTVRRLNQDTLKNLQELAECLDNQEDHVIRLFEIVLQISFESTITAVGVSNADIQQLKNSLVKLLLQHINKKTSVKKKVENLTKFEFLLKVGATSFSDLTADIKKQFQEKLDTLIRFALKSSNNLESVQFLLTTLKTSKTLNLNDEMKLNIVSGLMNCLKNTIKEKLLSTNPKIHPITIEISLLEILKTYRTNCGIECLKTIQENLEKTVVTADKLEYSFKLIQVLFEENNNLVTSYIGFCGMFQSKIGQLECEKKSGVLCQVLETHLSVLKINKKLVHLDTQLIDEMVYFMTDIKSMNPTFESIDEFYKFYNLFGEFLYMLSYFKQQYFLSRIPQFFNLYKNFMEAIYFYKTDSTDDFTEKEIDLLLKLSQQLENVMRNIISSQLNSIKIVLPYIVAVALNVFVKNPKTLSSGDKFKINIKNVCKHLIQHIDEKNKRFFFNASDETSREVFEGLFRELRRT